VIGAILAIAGLVAGGVTFWPAGTTVRSGLQQLASRVGSGPLKKLILLGVNPATLAPIAAKPELATLLDTVAAVPEIGALIRDGTYQAALREAIRQNVQSISEIRLDQVASPEARNVVAKVQAVLSKLPQGGAEAGSVNPRVLDLLQTPAFARLMQDRRFSEYLGRPAAESEID
jgi:hypothetical protein